MKLPIWTLPEFSDKQLPFFNIVLAKIQHAINNIEFGNGVVNENVFCTFATIVTPAGADTPFQVPHLLTRKPIGFFPIWKDKAADFYYAGPTSAWTSTNIYLKCNTASTSAVLLII